MLGQMAAEGARARHGVKAGAGADVLRDAIALVDSRAIAPLAA